MQIPKELKNIVNLEGINNFLGSRVVNEEASVLVDSCLASWGWCGVAT